MFDIKNVTKSYGSSSVKAVDSLNLTVSDGEIFGFLGPNGAGKTTTIKMLTGILRPSEGTISVDGINIADDPIAAKRRISFVPDTPETFSRLKAGEYLNFIADVYNISTQDRQERIEKYASMFDILPVLGNKIASFSHGMKQKLFLTASLVTDPQNWILDEPMVGLDPESAFKLKEIMRAQAAQGKTVFFSTHVMEVAEKLCDKVGIIKKGSLVFCGSMDELLETHGKGRSLEEVFLELTGALQ